MKLNLSSMLKYCTHIGSCTCANI